MTPSSTQDCFPAEPPGGWRTGGRASKPSRKAFSRCVNALGCSPRMPERPPQAPSPRPRGPAGPPSGPPARTDRAEKRSSAPLAVRNRARLPISCRPSGRYGVRFTQVAPARGSTERYGSPLARRPGARSPPAQPPTKPERAPHSRRASHSNARQRPHNRRACSEHVRTICGAIAERSPSERRAITPSHTQTIPNKSTRRANAERTPRDRRANAERTPRERRAKSTGSRIEPANSRSRIEGWFHEIQYVGD